MLGDLLTLPSTRPHYRTRMSRDMALAHHHFDCRYPYPLPQDRWHHILTDIVCELSGVECLVVVDQMADVRWCKVNGIPVMWRVEFNDKLIHTNTLPHKKIIHIGFAPMKDHIRWMVAGALSKHNQPDYKFIEILLTRDLSLKDVDDVN